MASHKISVIIPAYNAEKYIGECLDSILSQQVPDVEIICVDDGSTDSTPDIIDRYKCLTERVKALHQKNSGQGAARNAGVALADGEYIKFIDADDFLMPDALERMLDVALATNADITVCRTICVDAFGRPVGKLKMWNNYPHPCVPFSRLLDVDVFNNVLSPVLWDKLIKTDIVKRHLSPDLRRGQDFVTLIKYLSETTTVAYCEDYLYCYRHHKDSVMAQAESQYTINTDYITELCALDEINTYFGSTLAARLYHERILKEWTERLVRAKGLLEDKKIEDMLNQLTYFVH